MYAPAPHAPPPPQRSIWIWLGPFLGFVGILFLVAMVSLLRFCSRAADAGGVRASNEITTAILDGLEQKKVLLPGEKVLAYYDVTVAGDASDLAMVTSERLVYVKDGRTTAMALADIADVKSRNEG